MGDHPSLADRAVHALAEVAAMDRDVRSNDPECLVVWNLKDEAFARAARLACLAQATRRDMRQAIEAAQRPEVP